MKLFAHLHVARRALDLALSGRSFDIWLVAVSQLRDGDLRLLGSLGMARPEARLAQREGKGTVGALAWAARAPLCALALLDSASWSLPRLRECSAEIKTYSHNSRNSSYPWHFSMGADELAERLSREIELAEAELERAQIELATGAAPKTPPGARARL